MPRRPVIALTADLEDGKYVLKPDYVSMVVAAGGLPFLLPPVPGLVEEALGACDGLILTGGDDIDLSSSGVARHEASCIMDPRRQEAELGLLRRLDERPGFPVLGICLGHQMMGFHAGARILQHVPDEVPGGERHLADRIHAVEGELGSGDVTSWHHQALGDPGTLEVVARAPDGVIEAVRDPGRRFYLGVQWHPERTADPDLGLGILARLVEAARSAS